MEKQTADRSGPSDGDDLVGSLQRWQDSGAIWRVVARGEGRVTVGLFTCDGGEEVERLTSGAAEVLALVAGRESSES